MTISELQESQRRMHTPTNRDNPIIEGLRKGGLQNAPMNLQTSAPITVPVPVGPQVSMGGPLQGARGMSPGAMGGQDHMPPFVSDEAPRSPKVTKIGQILNKPVIGKDGNKTDLATEIVEEHWGIINRHCATRSRDLLCRE